MTFLDFTSKQKNFFTYKIKNLPQGAVHKGRPPCGGKGGSQKGDKR